MPINPIRVNPIDAPPPPRPMPLVDFSGISSFGESLGRARDQQEVGQILSGAVDPRTGALDLQKAASALAVTGRDPRQYLDALAREQALKQQTAHQAVMERIAQENAATAKTAAERPQYNFNPPDPIFGGGDIIEAPRVRGQPPVRHPWPTVTPPVVGPQSEADIPGAARYAAAGPAMGERLPPNYYPPPGGQPTPSEGPPYQQVAQAAPAPTTAPAAAPPARNEAFLRSLQTENARTLIKGVAEYEIDPMSLDPTTRARVMTAAKTYRPDYNMAEYQKRGSPPSAEVQARLSLGQLYLTRAPQIKERILAGEYTDAQSKMLAVVGQGGPGELRRAIDEGADGVQRLLTGAGMNKEEAHNYARRYQFDIRDTKDTALRKSNELEAVLRYLVTGVGEGRGGKNLLAGFEDQFGKPVLPEAAAPVRVSSPDEARRLPKGTPIILPDGRTGTVR